MAKKTAKKTAPKKAAGATPTWYGNIRDMFTQTDIDHMKPHGILLNDYDSVKSNAIGIYGQVSSGNMPPPPSKPWTAAEAQSFLDWISAGYPKGTPAVAKVKPSAKKSVASSSAARVRKDVNSLSAPEIKLLKKAFEGIMARDLDVPTNPQSYFGVAGNHGLPNPLCMHHIPGYNPWHRAYLVAFEDALRSVPGCENVTMPYWDIYGDFPDLLNQAPFKTYTYPVTLNSQYQKGDKTSRYSLTKMESMFKNYNVREDFTRAKSQTDWEDYHGGRAFGDAPNNTSIAAHDGGHVSIGPTMAVQNVAAFDPIFWFYHCNIDRMFWEWQKSMNATTLNGLLTTITTDNSRNIFTIEPLQALPPYTAASPFLKTVDIVDSVNNLDVDYDQPKASSKKSLAANFMTKRSGAVAASDKFHIDPEMAAVRVKGVNRVQIPGSFSVHLLKDGKKIASKAFFQPEEVATCSNCIANPVVDFDFHVPIKDLKGGQLSTHVEPVDHSKFGDKFPHKMMGSPTVNVRLLLKDQK